MAPAMMREIHTISKELPCCFITLYNHHPIMKMAIIRNKLRNNLPKLPPSFIPNAIPSFSVKWIKNQFPIILWLSPIYIVVFMKNFSVWSRSKTRMIMMTAFFNGHKTLRCKSSGWLVKLVCLLRWRNRSSGLLAFSLDA